MRENCERQSPVNLSAAAVGASNANKKSGLKKYIKENYTCHRFTSHTALQSTEDGILLRKLTNRAMESPSHDLPRELLLSHKRVLQAGEKPELQRRLERRRLEQHREQQQALQPRSDLEQELRKRQQKQLEYEKEEVQKRVDQENIPEFVRVKEKLRHIRASGPELP